MTNDDLLFRHRVRLFTRASEVGVHHSTYYRWNPLVGGCGPSRPSTGSEFRSGEFRSAAKDLGADHHFVRAGRPETNGCVKRVQRTMLEGLLAADLRALARPEVHALRRDLERHVAYFNLKCADLGRYTQGRAPGRSSTVLGKCIRADRGRGWPPARDRVRGTASPPYTKMRTWSRS